MKTWTISTLLIFSNMIMAMPCQPQDQSYEKFRQASDKHERDLIKALDEGQWQMAFESLENLERAREKSGFKLDFHQVDRIEILVGLGRAPEAELALKDLQSKDKSSGFVSWFGPNLFIEELVDAANNSLSKDKVAMILRPIEQRLKGDPLEYFEKSKKGRLAVVRAARSEAWDGHCPKKSLREAREVLAEFPNNPVAAFLAARSLRSLKREPEEELRLWMIAAELAGPWGEEARKMSSLGEK